MTSTYQLRTVVGAHVGLLLLTKHPEGVKRLTLKYENTKVENGALSARTQPCNMRLVLHLHRLGISWPHAPAWPPVWATQASHTALEASPSAEACCPSGHHTSLSDLLGSLL